MGLEIERKFLMDKAVAISFIEELGRQGIEVTKKRIEQNYLFEENSFVTYDYDKNVWLVALKMNHRKIEFRIPALVTEYEEIKEALADIDLDNLAAIDDCAIRIRILNGQPIFTFKRSIENSIADYEFEYPIQTEPASYKSDCILFCKADPFNVSKDRYIFDYHGQVIEIDLFDKFDFAYLESEFLFVDAARDYNFDIFPIKKEVTKEKGASNKELAYMAGKQARP